MTAQSAKDLVRTCFTCGQQVWQFNEKTYDRVIGHWYVGELERNKFGITPPKQERFIYINHVCNQEDIDAFAGKVDFVVQQLEKLKEQIPSEYTTEDLNEARKQYRSDMDRYNEVIAEHALLSACPKCDAEIGQRCENLTTRRQGLKRYTAAPHKERIELPNIKGHSEIKLVHEKMSADASLLNKIEQALASKDAIAAIIELVHNSK